MSQAGRNLGGNLGHFAVIRRDQALAAGLSRDQIASNLASGRWQWLHRAVYVTHNGPVPFHARVHAAVLACGTDAVASHWTAAALSGLVDPPKWQPEPLGGDGAAGDGRLEAPPPIHVSVPDHRRIATPSGVRLHLSPRLPGAGHPLLVPARTRIEETVLDLTDYAGNEDMVVGWLAAACGRRLTTPDRIQAALAARKRARWRALINDALADVGEGTHSVLERRYLRHVERAHRLPRGQRQALHEQPYGQIYDDIWYAEFRTVVELDGRAAHPATRRGRDLRRDNVAVVRGDSVLHFLWSDVASRPCATAVQVATVLRAHGWRGHPRPCSPSCVIRER